MVTISDRTNEQMDDRESKSLRTLYFFGGKHTGMEMLTTKLCIILHPCVKIFRHGMITIITQLTVIMKINIVMTAT